ncbi:hypothetical protein QBC34DRAFT_49219 [Podospora aff. communis PSN243]|uniref:Uncharacterized protein n=1 Tax=Podospora aff. communis PSN243 TaxID=3040156 RepID=A0AAV9GTG9_9PEZI|nr:hypothetical protein QBC34DRAFT_49219 [Podospora aff. communis PSN243]
MNDIQVLLRTHRRLETRGGHLCQVTKVFACGCMVGTAILFPLANVGDLWFRCATLSIFIITALAFHALHVEPFVRFGPFTAPLALFILLLAVLPPDSPRTELIPWLPLFIASFSLSTVAVHEIHKRHVDQEPRISLEDGPSDISIGTWSYRSAQMEAASDQESRHTLGNSTIDVFLLGLHDHQLEYPVRHDSDISLSDGSSRLPSDWDSETRSFFPRGNTSPSSTRSNDLLLGPQ